MKRQKAEGFNAIAERDKSWKISVFGTVAIIAVMLVYLVISVASSNKLAEQTDIISKHPFEVVISAGNIKSNISEMRLHIERLQVHSMPDDVARVSSSIYDIRESMDALLENVEDLYLGDPAHVVELSSMLDKLYEAQGLFFDYVNLYNPSSKEIEAYQSENLNSLYDGTLDSVENIINVAAARKVAYGELSTKVRSQILVGSFVMIGMMIAGLIILQYVLFRQRHELARHTALLNNLSENIDDTFIIWDADTEEVDYVALNIERVMGCRVERLDDVYKGFKQEDAAEVFDAVRDGKIGDSFTKVAEYKLQSGEKRWISIHINPAKNIKNSLLINFFSDCTDDIRSRQALMDAMNNAEKANDAKGEFLSRMSHEIRTPLNGIIGMTTIAAASVKDPVKIEDCLTKINFSSKHLLMLINDVLDMSKIDSNKMQIYKENFDLFKVINSFISTIFAQAKEKGVEFSEMAEGFDGCMEYIGEPLRLSQILLNLGSNAIKFTPPGGKVSLHVSRISSRLGIDILRFTVSDTGIGMTQEELGRIFKPFEQANASISSRYGGTGLGMAITHNLVTLMDGRIEIKSEPGVGTECIVELPFQVGHNMILDDFAEYSLHALVVDDEQSVCEEITSLMKTIKIQTEWVLTGEEAVKKVIESSKNREDFDICLVDWKIPDMDGIEITRRIREGVGWELPIIIISAYDYTEIEEEARKAGANAFLSKPLYRSSVYSVIKTTLHLSDGKPEAQDTIENTLRGKRLLIVEDNKINMEILKQLLEMSGVETEQAENGEEAVQKFLESAPGYFDAVLMDVKMPIMDGYEATRVIRLSDHENAKTVPIIAITANAFNEDIANSLAAGMNAHVSKPIDLEQLHAVLMKIWKQK